VWKLCRPHPDTGFHAWPDGPACDPHVVIDLQIQPDFREYAEILAEAKGDVKCGLIPSRRAASYLADRNAFHAVARTDGVHDVLARHNLSEDCVLAVEMRLRRVGDEKLAPVRARSGVCH
jgi:hypothetical protein